MQPLFQCVMQRLSGQDQDQEVKECAITCMASIIACLGDVLLPEVPQALRVSLLASGLDVSHPLSCESPTSMQSSIACMASIITWLGNVLLPEVPQALRVSLPACSLHFSLPARPMSVQSEGIQMRAWCQCICGDVLMPKVPRALKVSPRACGLGFSYLLSLESCQYQCKPKAFACWP